ncbi:MAG: alpha-2-macroglobulin family protein [Dysgonomonas sp.]
MKKRILVSFILLFSLMTMSAQTSNNKYENEWKEVERNEKESLPQSAIKEVDEILQKAIADNNTTQIIKALIYKNKYKKDIDRQDNEGLIKDIEALIPQVDNVTEKSLLHSMLAELYWDFYNSNQWQINQRTKLTDLVPEDLKEWSSNIFIDKVIENLDLSIKDITVLKNKTTTDYNDIILLGTDGYKYYPTLYDFLMSRAIEVSKPLWRSGGKEFDTAFTGVGLEQLVLPADEYVNLNIASSVDNSYIILAYYQEFLKDLLKRNLTSTIVLTDIDRVQYLVTSSRSLFGEKGLDVYTKLYNRYEGNEISTEIIDKLTDSYNYSFLTQNQINKRIYDWLQKGINKYPNSYGAKILKSKLNQLETPTLNIKGNDLQTPGKAVKISIIHKNIQMLDEETTITLYQQQKGKYNVVKEYPLSLVSETTYNADTLSLNLGILPFGKYSFTTLSQTDLENSNSNEYENNRFDFVVSNLMALSRVSAKDEYEILVVDHITGKPIKGATVKIYPHQQDTKNKNKGLYATLRTNELGLAFYKDNEVDREQYGHYVANYTVQLGADSCLNAGSLYGQNYRWTRSSVEEEKQSVATVFIDRSVYRPGQTVHFKAVVLNGDSKLIPDKVYTVKLYNPNNEIVSQKDIITNEFGSISGEFILPQTGLLGGYRIEVENGSVYFNVEEYKRPTFEITFDKVDKTYTFGEEVKVKGYAKNFSGVNLQDANVKYSIAREQFSFWFWRSGNRSHFADGTVKTNADGSFEIVFTPEAGDGERNLFRIANNKQVYTFNVTATVTDVNGETQSNTYMLTVGNVSMVINIDIPEQIEKSVDYKLNIGARNLQAQDIEASGSYQFYRLNDKDSIQSKVSEGLFKTGDQPELKAKLKTLPSGKYKLKVKAQDDKGNDVNEEKDFTLYSYTDKKPPVKTSEWLVQKNTIFGKDNKPAEIIYGTTDKDAYILYQLSNNNKVFERKIVKISNANQTFTVPYKAEYGDGINMSFTSIREDELYNQNVQLTKEEEKTDTKLNVKLEVFRDKLRPGQSETWTISVKDTTNTPVKAELLASMYDTSLDKIYSYISWSLNRPQLYKEYLYPVNYNPSSWYGEKEKWFEIGNLWKKDGYTIRTFDRINWFGYLPEFSNLSNMLGGRVAGVVQESAIGAFDFAVSPVAATREKFAAKEDAVLNEVVIIKGTEPVVEQGQGELDENGLAPQIRQNFAETAFFFPQLRTNEKGETLISFTVPESNTTWRFRALAHDKDARVGVFEQMVVTRKELMVTPNMSRFVREGDKTSISTKISNLSENAISGDVRIEFFDPVTDNVIDLNLANKKQSFSIEKDASTSASWTFDIPSGIELLGCRIVAQNETFSDGEQHVLAVLSDKMLVTESMPIDITKSGTSTFTFDKLYSNKSATTDNYRLTLEYASNPAWYAIQALPTMSNPSNDNAVNWFASYYVNTLGSSIARQYPKVTAMIQAWLKQGGDKHTLVSKLQKDEELKAILLEETPWVLDAQNETEQMQRLSLLFDLNNIKQLTDAATRKLAELMNSNGGWSWYKGLYPSRSISQYILYGYAKLQQIGQVEYPQEIKEMQMSALKFIDKQILDDFNNLKKNNKDWEKSTSVSTNQIEFAFVRSFYRDIPINQETREAERFYTNIASKNWTKLGMYERAILSMILKRNGDKELAGKIVKSIKEHAVNDKKLGMYWPNNRSNVFMSMSAISVHTFLMDALQENGAAEQEMNAMKRWLLSQKQTQVWESSHASIDAISTLLNTGSDWFKNEGTATIIKVSDTKVEPENKELGTGYFKQTWSKSEIDNNMGKVEVTTPSSDPAYGALYWQYYESLDKITAQKGDLNIDKQLFKENVTASGKGLTQITENNPLTVGDKVVVRLIIRVDRDMEFVQLKDMRAPCFEPEQTISGIRWANGLNGLIYYQTPKDASTNFYFDHLPKGTYVLEYPVYVNRSGEYSNGITTIQCIYAPQFVSHTQGIKVIVKDK